MQTTFLTNQLYITILFVISGLFVGIISFFVLFKFKKRKNKITPIQFDEVRKNLRIQEFLVNFTNLLNGFSPFDHQLVNALHILGRFLKASRIYIFEDINKGLLTRNTFEWNDPEIPPMKDKNLWLTYKNEISELKHFLIKDGILCLHNFETYHTDFRDFLEQRRIKSLVILPLYIQNELYGFIGVDLCTEIRIWNDMEIGLLKTISALISNAFERRNNEIELKNSECKFRDLFDNSGDSIFIFNQHGILIEVNERACSLLDIPKDELLQQDIDNILSLSSASSNIVENNLIIKTSQTFYSELKTINNRIIPVEINSLPITYANRQAFMFVARDISERKKMEAEIFSTIIKTEEKERGRIARDLHDGLAPLLSSLKMYTKVLEESLEPAHKIEILNSANEAITESMLLIKEITNNLSPQVLHDFGLASAIQSFCKKISVTKAIVISFESNVYDVRFNQNLEMILFRILKELVNNTIKHAQASKIEIFLLRTDTILSLVYSDNGVGFDFQQTLNNRSSGMGISNIVNQIRSIKGKLFFESTPLKGIQVKMEIDLA